MPKAEKFKMQKVTVNLYHGDFARLREIGQDSGGGGYLLRRIVRKYLDEVEAKAKVSRPKINVEV